MNLLHAIILGIVEGLTEFLPISSTGHLILTARLLRIPSSDFLSTFEIAIQAGAILAVLVLYGKMALFNIKILKRITAAFLPTAFIGFFLYKVIKQVLLNNVPVVLISLFVGGIFLIVFERFYDAKRVDTEALENITYKQCVLIGLFQSLAVIPGVSRSAATIVGGLILGINRKVIVEFSFLLALPTLLAATGFDLLKSGYFFPANQWDLLAVGFIVSFFVALLSIKFLIHYIKNHSFTVFGFYRVALAVLFWFMI